MHGYSLRRIVSVAGIIAALALAIIAGAIWKLREDALAEADRDVSGLASILSEQVQQSAQGIDLALNEVAAIVGGVSERDFVTAASGASVTDALATIAQRHPAIELISINDADGVAIATSRGRIEASGPIYLQFDFLRNNRTRETLISDLRVSDVTGAQVVDFFRRVEAADGHFLGVVRASVTPETLVKSYSPLSTMPGRSYALFSRDGAILTRYPDAFGAAGGRLPLSSPWYDAVARGGGVYRTYSAFDGRDRIIAAHPVPFSQLVVSVTVLRRVALARWRDQAIVILACGALAAIIAAFLLKALMVQFGKVSGQEQILREQSRALELSNLRFATALENMSQGLVVFDKGGRVVICNRRYESIYGLPPGSISTGTSARRVLELRAARGIFAGDTPESYVRNALSRTFTDRRIDHLKDGRAIMVNHARCPEGGIVVTHEDITEREEANARIAHMAMHDELTRLGNRALFRQTLDDMKREIESSGGSIVLMLIDLDDFKPVNDIHGHIAGDGVLRECAERIVAAAPFARIVARLGGDEFALAYKLPDGEGGQAIDWAERLVRRIAEPYNLHGQLVEIGACIGVGIYDDPGLSIDDMMRRADLALYAAKGEGARRVRAFEPQMELVALTRRELAADLAQALVNEELTLVYQPIVDATTLQIRQMEALLRWTHPRKGPIPPQDFIRLAEETRLIDQLGAWVLKRACAEASNWPKGVGVAVNVSPLQLHGADFFRGVIDALDSAGLDAKRLELEITETALLQDRGENLGALRRLREAGVSIALDDFGTGYSSLSYLKRFPFDRIKIDRSFVADVCRDGASSAIIASTVHLARSFEIEITAEGVETAEQYQALRESGVTSMQGYLFGRPGSVVAGLPDLAWSGRNVA